MVRDTETGSAVEVALTLLSDNVDAGQLGGGSTGRCAETCIRAAERSSLDLT